MVILPASSQPAIVRSLSLDAIFLLISHSFPFPSLFLGLEKRKKLVTPNSAVSMLSTTATGPNDMLLPEMDPGLLSDSNSLFK